MTSSVLLDSLLFFLSEDPMTRAVQGGLLFISVFIVYLLFFVTRDILLRTTSIWYQLISIAMVFCLPIVGFFLYLLVRPSRTVAERNLEEAVQTLLKKYSQPRKQKA